MVNAISALYDNTLSIYCPVLSAFLHCHPVIAKISRAAMLHCYPRHWSPPDTMNPCMRSYLLAWKHAYVSSTRRSLAVVVVIVVVAGRGRGRSKFWSRANWNFLAHWHGNTFSTLHVSPLTYISTCMEDVHASVGTHNKKRIASVPSRRSLESV